MKQTRGRIDRLVESMLGCEHGSHRVFLNDRWDTCHLSVSLAERKASALQNMLMEMPVAIGDDELIIGTRTVFQPVREHVVAIDDPSSDVSFCAFPHYLTDEERVALGSPGWEGSSKGHQVAGYAKILRFGFQGIIEQTEQRLQGEDDPSKQAFLRAVITAYQGAISLALRYSALAEELASHHDGLRFQELIHIADVCRHIAQFPAHTLHQAIQLFWFAHLAVIVENQALMSFGRLDQTLAPYWDTCSAEDAQELLECLIIKMNDQADIRQGEGFYGSDNVVLSGMLSDGSDATNVVSYACLRALDRLRLPNPLFNVRLHRLSPKKLINQACALSCQGVSQLAFYNDDTIVPALAGAGFPLTESRNYALDACQDILIEGLTDFFMGGHIHLTPILLNTLDQVDDDSSFEDVMAKYRELILQKVVTLPEESRVIDEPYRCSPALFLSGSMDGCIENAVDITQGGLPYLNKGVFLMSPVNAVNSLAALKKVVYDDQFATLSQLKQACSRNFEGDDLLRQRLLTASKWGNDDDYVDLLAKELFESTCKLVQQQNYRNKPYLSGIHQPHHVGSAKGVGATPDGRKAGEPFPVTLTPSNGSEKHGPTAVIRSLTKIDPMVCQWNHAFNMQLQPQTVDGEPGLARYIALLRTYFDLGGIQWQGNVLSPDELRAAKQDPEDHRNLIVRVWGFCARFVDLSPDYQDEIIARTTHRI